MVWVSSVSVLLPRKDDSDGTVDSSAESTGVPSSARPMRRDDSAEFFEEGIKGGGHIRPIEHPCVSVGNPMRRDLTHAMEHYGVSPKVIHLLADSCRAAMLVGLINLEKAGLISAASDWKLPPEMQDDTGIIFASSFAHHETALQQATDRARRDMDWSILDEVRGTLRANGVDPGLVDGIESKHKVSEESRKLVLQLLLQANVQLAEKVSARGPNSFSSTACASTTTAIKLAANEIQLGHAKAMLVVAADSLLSSDACNGIVDSFVRLKAASKAETPEEAVKPFSVGRAGFVLGDGAISLLMTSEPSKQKIDEQSDGQSDEYSAQVRIVSSRIANSAHHGTGLHSEHITSVLRKCVDDLLRQAGCQCRGNG